MINNCNHWYNIDWLILHCSSWRTGLRHTVTTVCISCQLRAQLQAKNVQNNTTDFAHLRAFSVLLKLKLTVAQEVGFLRHRFFDGRFCHHTSEVLTNCILPPEIGGTVVGGPASGDWMHSPGEFPRYSNCSRKLGDLKYSGTGSSILEMIL